MEKRKDRPSPTSNLTKEETVAMTIQIPLSIHTRMKMAAIARQKGLYQMVNELFAEEF